MGDHSPSGYEPIPAIVRSFEETDATVSVIHTPTDSVTHTRGRGDSGYRIETVEHDCPTCGFDRMVRRHDVRPELEDGIRYWCLNPNCAHFVRDHLSHAMYGNYPQRAVQEPEIYEEA